MRACFNPRARVGRDIQDGTCWMEEGCRFNPRARVGRDDHAHSAPADSTSFNPRARVGRDGRVSPELALVPEVSIHAPA